MVNSTSALPPSTTTGNEKWVSLILGPLMALLVVLKVVSERVIAYRTLQLLVERIAGVAHDLDKRFERAKNTNTIESDNIRGHHENFVKLQERFIRLSGWYQIIFFPFSREGRLLDLEKELDSLRDEVFRIEDMALPFSDNEPLSSSRIESEELLGFANLHPLRDAKEDVRNDPELLPEVCKERIIEENCRRSLDEWLIAHELLMEAVTTEAVPKGREYEGKNWMNELYRQVVKLGITEREAKELELLFQVAESNQVVGPGATDILAVAVTRQDTQMVNAIHELFKKQAELNARQEGILRYLHKNALLTWFAAIIFVLVNGVYLNISVALSAFVILVGKWLVRGPVRPSSRLDRAIQRRQARPEWKATPLEHGKIDDDVAASLRMSRNSLRDRIGCFRIERVTPTFLGETVSSDRIDDDTAQNEIRATPDNDALSGDRVERKEVDESHDSATSTCGEAKDGETRRSLVSELDKWKSIGLANVTLENLGSEEIAGVISAFLVHYNRSREDSYDKLRKSLWKHFHSRCVYGSSFVDANQEDQVRLLEVARLAISEVATGDTMHFLEMRLRRFVRNVCKP